MDEAPDFGEDDDTDLTIIEGETALDSNADADGVQPPSIYDADDEDTVDGSVEFSVSDTDNFTITGGTLTFTGDAPDYETQSEYKVTITAVGNRGIGTADDDSDDSTATFPA